MTRATAAAAALRLRRSPQPLDFLFLLFFFPALLYFFIACFPTRHLLRVRRCCSALAYHSEVVSGAFLCVENKRRKKKTQQKNVDLFFLSLSLHPLFFFYLIASFWITRVYKKRSKSVKRGKGTKKGEWRARPKRGREKDSLLRSRHTSFSFLFFENVPPSSFPP